MLKYIEAHMHQSSIKYINVNPNIIVGGVGGKIGHAKQNLVKSARVGTIITLIYIKQISMFDTVSVMTNTSSFNLKIITFD